MDSAALQLRWRFGRSGGTELSDNAVGDRRGGDGWETSSALPPMDMDSRNLEDWGGGSTAPVGPEHGREADTNSCLQRISIFTDERGL